MATEEDAVKVCVRVRPIIHREQGDQVPLFWKAENSTISQVDGTRSFHFENRHYGETKMNEHSSRSHTIFRMIVESRDCNDPANSENCDGAVMVSHLASSVSKANAMANEEHSQLLAVIQQLQKEKEERISNLKNIVVDAAVFQQISLEDQQPKRKRRVTWAAEKIKSTLFGAGVHSFDAGSKISTSFPKRAKMSDLSSLPENDDSLCTEFSDFDETTRMFEDFCPDWDGENRITFREKTTFHHSMIDFNSDAQLHSRTMLMLMSLALLLIAFQAQLIHEIGNLKKVVENAELYNQELEAELENKSKVLKEQEKQIADLKKDAEVLLKKSRYSDLSESMGGDSEKLWVFFFIQDELSLRCQQREKDAAALEKQLESEKFNYKQMQADLQKELQCAFNEINQLNGLMAGRVPKDLLSRVELEKKIADYSKQLTKALEEKSDLEKEVAYLSELKSLPSEIEQLKNQVEKSSDELHLLRNEKEQSVSLISNQSIKMQEQEKQIERLMEEVTNTQAKLQQAEQQYSDIKILHKDLQAKCLNTDEEIKKKDLEVECLVKEMNALKQSLEILEEKLFNAQREGEELAQAQQELSSHNSSMEETLKSTVSERDDLQGQVSNANEANSETIASTKMEAVADNKNLVSEIEVLKERIKSAELGLATMEGEKNKLLQNLNALEEYLQSVTQQRDELENSKKDLLIEKDELRKEVERTTKQLKEEFKPLSEKHSHEDVTRQLLEQIEKEKEKLLESLKAVTDERDQLKLDLHENIEMILHLEERLCATVTERDHLSEEFQLLTEQKKSLEVALSAVKYGLPDKETQDKEVQVLTKVFADENEIPISTRLEEAETERTLLKERIDHLQQQIFIISQEREQQQQLIDTLKSENCQLASVVKRPTEDEAMQISTTEDLTSEIEKLKEQFKNTSQQLALKDQEAKEAAEKLIDLKKTDTHMAELEMLEENLQQSSILLEKIQAEKVELSDKLCALQEEMEKVTCYKDNLQGKLEAVLSENSSLKEILETALSSSSTTQEEIQKSQELQQEGIMLNGRVPVQDKDTSTDLMPITEEQVRNPFLMYPVKKTQLETLRSEKLDIEEKFLHLQHKMEKVTQEWEDLKASQEILILERDQLKEALDKNIEMLKTPESRQEQLEVAAQTETLINGDLDQLLKKLKDMESQLANVQTEKVNNEEKLFRLQEHIEVISKERDELQSTLDGLQSERDQLKEDLKENIEMSIETQIDLRSAQEEISTQKERVSELTKEIASLEEKSSLLETELYKTTTVLKEVTSERENLDQSKQKLTSEVEQLLQQLKDQELALFKVEKEKSEASKKVFELTSVLSGMAEEKDQLNCSKEDVEKQLFSLQRELQENITLLKEAVEEKEVLYQAKQKLSSDIEQLMESLKSKDRMLEFTESEKGRAAQKVLELTEEVRNLSLEREQLQLFNENLEEETDKADLQTQIQQYELEVASLRQEQDQFQQLLQRARSEKENICTNLEDQEKANEQIKKLLTTCQAELEFVRKERDESKDHLTDKVNEINSMLQQLSCLQEQLQQLQQELKDERIKNIDLCEKVDDLDKEIRVLRLIQNEPEQEEDEIAERTEVLQQKNQELMDLMVNISTMYSNQHRSLSNLSEELQAEVEAQKQSINAILESLSSTHSREIGTLQTEYNKLHSQLQTLLNKYKIIYRNAAVKEEQYSLVNGYESDLCVVQKKNDELHLQCQSLEQNGTKWSESAAEELKFCELEFLNHLIYKKMEVMKKMQSRNQQLENEITSAKADAKQKEAKASLLQEKLHRIASLKSCIEYKEECLRKLKEQLRRSQKDTDTTICSDKDGAPSYPLTCGGGSGIVQSTAILMLQSENAALKREMTHYKKRCLQLRLGLLERF
ncbi:centromere-associated protein E [Pyxicephalus adspersus]|uniref:centromere-associated protein E n=1 Tax=Pyxicephalus adspersus TaxID=30357 RepID=UPI003B5A731A